MSNFTISLALSVCAVSAGCTHPYARPVAPMNRAIVVPLHRVPGSRLRSVQVQVGGDSAEFLFDTGNGTTLIDSTVARRLGCEPRGIGVGFRMNGEKLAGPRCEDVAIAIGPIGSSSRAGVVSMAALLDRPNTTLRGVVSLLAFRGRIVTLDLAHDELIVETGESARARTANMHPIPARIATGMSGEDLDVFVGIRAAGMPLWFEWDSGHQASTFVAPHAARALGIADSLKRADARMSWGADAAVVPVQVRDIIYDGVLSAAFIERAQWTVDLAAGRMWVGALAPVLAVSESGSGDVYDVRTTIGGNVRRAVMRIHGDATGWHGEQRELGDDETVALRNVSASDTELRYELPLRQPTTVTLSIVGDTASGEWSFGGRPARTVAVRRR